MAVVSTCLATADHVTTVWRVTRVGKKSRFLRKKIRSSGFINFIFCQSLLGVAYLRYRQYVGNPTVATGPTLPIYYLYLYFVHLKC